MRDSTKLIDALIEGGLQQMKTERPTVTIPDYLRALRLADDDNRDETPQVIWRDRLKMRDAA